MSSAAANSGRKRRRDDAHEGATSTPRRRRRRLLSPSSFPAVRSFSLRVSLANSLHKPRKRRRDDASSSARLRRCRRRLLCPSQFSPVRSIGLRVALAAGPRRRRKRRVVDARRPVSTPLRGRRHKSPLPRIKHFLGIRPFALRFLLATGASARRRRRKPAVVGMGNYISRLLGKNTSDNGLVVHRGRVDGSQDVRDLTVEPELEAENADVVRRGLGYWSAPAFQPSTPPEKSRHDKCNRRLPEAEFEGRLQELKIAELPGVLAHKPDEDLSELFKPLTDKDEIEVNAVLHGSGHSEKIIVMHEPSNIEVTKEKIQCLRPRGWLNDEVINLYIELLKERAEREPRRFLKCHFFNTFFYKKLTCGIDGYDYQSVRRWTTFKKLGYTLTECEKIFVPVHRDVHWCLAVINMKDRTFQYLDSLGGMDRDVLKVLARYIMDELKDKSNIDVDINSWVEVSDSIPLQKNGWDCGMFMLKFIDFLSRSLKPCFSQEHMPYFRKRTAREIMTLRAD